MESKQNFRDAKEFAQYLKAIHEDRGSKKKTVIASGAKRHSLTTRQREVVFAKTNGRCHICGGKIAMGQGWEADHVLAHALGGEKVVDNCLPAHSTCNHYRWFYAPEEFQMILKLGVWTRTLIEKQGKEAMELAERFLKHEKIREGRQKKQRLD